MSNESEYHPFGPNAASTHVLGAFGVFSTLGALGALDVLGALWIGQYPTCSPSTSKLSKLAMVLIGGGSGGYPKTMYSE